MAKTKNKKNGKQPDIKSREGIFQLSGWNKEVVIPAKNDYDVEREVKYLNLCLNVGVRKNGKWENVQIWFRRSQFANLKTVVDDFAEQLKKLNETEAEEGGVE